MGLTRGKRQHSGAEVLEVGVAQCIAGRGAALGLVLQQPIGQVQRRALKPTMCILSGDRG